MEKDKFAEYFFIALFVLFSVIVVFFDIKEARILHFTFDEKVFFPAMGIILVALWLIFVKSKITKKTIVIREIMQMSIVSKILLLFGALFFLAGILIFLFEDLSFISMNPSVISEERFIGLAMLASIILFIFNYGREIRGKKHA